MPGRRVYVRTLERALRIIGNEEALAELLWVRPATLRHYLSGEARPPDDVFLKAVDILFNNAWGATRKAPEDPARTERRQRAQDMARSTAELLRTTDATLQATKELRAETVALRDALKASAFSHRLFDPAYRPKDRQDVLQTGLDAALQAASTDRGDIELIDGGGALHIEVWRGFSEALLKFFDGGSEPRSACALALAEHRQIVVADVMLHALYAGTPMLEVLRAADIRAICATPLMSPAGEALGVVSTHFHEAKAPKEEQLEALDVVAKRTSALLQAA